MISTKLLDSMSRSNEIYIYGMGQRSQRLYSELKLDYTFLSKFRGYILTDSKIGQNKENVFSINEIKNKDALILLALSDANTREVKSTLIRAGFCNYMHYDEMGYFTGNIYEVFKNATEDDYAELLQKWYFQCTHKELDIEYPITFNEKLQWLKLYDDMSSKYIYVDKYLVKDYVTKKIGKKYVVPNIGVWEKYDDINFRDMPKKFILKCNHGCKWNRIITNVEDFDIKTNKQFFDAWMNTNYAYFGLELQYKKIKPKILAEELLEPDKGSLELLDYKFFVFDGKAKLIQVDFNRFSRHTRDLYSTNWERINGSIRYPNTNGPAMKKPECLNEMIQIAEILGQGFKHVRVDLYYTQGRVYFGEMTFTHGSGIEIFSSSELAIQMGDWIKIE